MEWVGLGVQTGVHGEPLNLQTPPICSNPLALTASLLPCCDGGMKTELSIQQMRWVIVATQSSVIGKNYFLW
jgi:hypothetical protein